MTVPPASRTGAPTREATVVLWFPHLLIDAGARLPDFADLRLHHGLTSFAPEGGRELRHVGDDAIDAGEAGRVRVGRGLETAVGLARVLAGPLGEADEEALVGRESFGRLQVRVCRGFLPGDVG